MEPFAKTPRIYNYVLEFFIDDVLEEKLSFSTAQERYSGFVSVLQGKTANPDGLRKSFFFSLEDPSGKQVLNPYPVAFCCGVRQPVSLMDARMHLAN